MNIVVTVGRGPVPRRAWDNRTFARDRPSRYGFRENAPGIERSRGTGPRATVSGTGCLITVGRGPVPRRARGAVRSRGTGPRATVSGAGSSLTVGRGPVPRRARGAMNVREGQALALR